MLGRVALAASLTAVVAMLYARFETASPPLATVLNTSYDYIIVGAGSAGCVLASRLSESGDVTVLLVEAGNDDRGDERISVPSLAGLLHHSERDWDYTTTTQRNGLEGLENQKIYVPAGRVLGGSSSTNYMLYVRGHPQDYDQWAAQGGEGWSYKDVLPYFMKSEDAQDKHLKSGYHGTGGPLKVEVPYSGGRLADALLQAGQEMGLNVIDSNADREEGVSLTQITARKGERYSTSKAFLHPALHRRNLHVAVNTYVTKVLFEDKRALGVEMIRGHKKQVVLARREVIVSAGAIGSPKLLLLSGVGPKQHLKDLSISVKADLPVGENHHDHVMFDYQVGLKQPLGRTPEDLTSLWTWAQLKLLGSGPLSNVGEEVQLFLSTSNDSRRLQWPDVQIMTVHGVWGTGLLNVLGHNKQTLQETAKRDQTKHGLVCIPIVLRPKSRGTLRLQSSDPYDDPLIDPNYFQHPEDIASLVRGVRACQRLVATPSLQALGATEVDDPSEICVGQSAYNTDQYWACVVRRRAKSVFHHVGTCKMGGASDKTAVVDPQLKVRGLQNLRVVDASIIPTVPSGNTNAAVIMLAEKAADMIRHQS